MIEEAVDSTARKRPPVSMTLGGPAHPVRIGDVDPIGANRLATGVGELDRVLSGGLVPGSATLLGGEPGMGKSTLLLQALGAMAAKGVRCLLVSAEESLEQVRMRAERLGTMSPELYVVSETNLDAVMVACDELEPTVLAVDSIQTVLDPESPGTAGSVSQVRDCAQRLVRHAKQRQLPTILVGHVTKDGALAGPRVLEHVVDTVLAFDGERHQSLRLLHATKHRFGSTQELGLFEMASSGLLDVPDASALFLADRCLGAPGSVVVPILQGARPMLVEVQALVATSNAPMPRRSAQGIDAGRLSLLVAVLEQRVGVNVTGNDIFASVAGGVRVVETGVDLGLALAVAGARHQRVMPANTVAVGEVGLGGELRQVPQIQRRLTEASRLGFRRAIVPASTAEVDGMELCRVSDLETALQVAGLGVAGRA